MQSSLPAALHPVLASVLLAAVALSPLSAQGLGIVTVPPGGDVAARQAWSLDSHTHRNRTLQHVVAAAAITASRDPLRIRGLVLTAMPGGSAARVTLDIRLGHGATTPRTMSDTLAENRRGTMSTTFSGVVDVPAVSPSAAPAPVSLPFANAFTYDPKQGDLIVEVVETSRVAAAAAFQLATMATPATITRRGGGGPMSSTTVPWFPPIDLLGTTLVSGATPVDFRDAFLEPAANGELRLTLRAAGKTTVFALGLDDDTAMALDDFGFQKNHLYVKPLAVLPATGHTTIPYLSQTCPADHSVISFRFKAENALNGLGFTAQGFTTDFPLVAFTDAMDVRFGPQDRDYLRGDHVRVVEALTGARRGRFPTAWFGGLEMDLVVEVDEAGK